MKSGARFPTLVPTGIGVEAVVGVALGSISVGVGVAALGVSCAGAVLPSGVVCAVGVEVGIVGPVGVLTGS